MIDFITCAGNKADRMKASSLTNQIDRILVTQNVLGYFIEVQYAS